MSDVDEAEIQRRAQANCSRDGFDWEVAVLKPDRFTQIRLTLDKAGRDEYLAAAREQLADERDGDGEGEGDA
jgi:hypothetical protein